MYHTVIQRVFLKFCYTLSRIVIFYVSITIIVEGFSIMAMGYDVLNPISIV